MVGGGKTAMDACCWLLDRGTAPDAIVWIRPRDSWILNRAFFQASTGLARTFEGVVLVLEAVASSESVDDVYRLLENLEIVLRTDRSVWPTMLRGATSSRREVDQLRRISNVVRSGHVQ